MNLSISRLIVRRPPFLKRVVYTNFIRNTTCPPKKDEKHDDGHGLKGGVPGEVTFMKL